VPVSGDLDKVYYGGLWGRWADAATPTPQNGLVQVKLSLSNGEDVRGIVI